MARVAFLLLVLAAACAAPPKPADGRCDGRALLVERNAYAAYDLPDLDVEHVNVARMERVLRSAGWPAERIRVLREPSPAEFRREVRALRDRLDGDDLVLLYFFGHGEWLDGPVGWDDFFPDAWADLPAARRVLVLDVCRAGALLGPLADDPRPQLLIGAVEADEAAWAGERDEGLPILGAVFTRYFTAAFTDPTADADGDGRVSCQEAAHYADPRQREYIQSRVLTEPRFVEAFHAAGVHPERDPAFPRVVVSDSLGNPVLLTD